MKTKNIIEGLQTLMPYYHDRNDYTIGAEHDTLYAYVTDDPLSEQDVKKMIELDWVQEYCNVDFSVDDYDPDESWVNYL